jgi:glycosyltransferase involved in cell wall biosynthesis
MMGAPRVAFVVNAEAASPLADRAHQLRARLQDRYTIQVACRSPRRVRALVRFLVWLARVRPSVVYVFDMSYSGVLAALLCRALGGGAVIIETGDAIYELVRSTGSRGPMGRAFTAILEWVSLRGADAIVVRGHGHQEWLARRGIRASVIQDGVDPARFRPEPMPELRRRYGLDDALTIGLVGSSIWSEALQMCYGWEVVETIRLLRGAPVKGVIIGDGSGIPHLQARCRDYGIVDRVVFLGRVPYDELPRYLNMIDICLSTQTNNVVGQVRTTGKLPLYLATGRYVLASRVGEAARLLDDEMLVEYDGAADVHYPAKLAQRIRALLHDPEIATRGLANRATAIRHFDYAVLGERAAAVIEETLQRR